MTPPYLVLHCEEFAWPRMSPRAPVRSYIKPPAIRKEAAPFHPSPAELFSAGWSVFCCTCRRPTGFLIERPAVSGLAAL